MESAINLGTLISAIVSVLGAAVTAGILLYEAKAKRDVLKATETSSMADAAESVASGAKMSNEMLMQRLSELDIVNKNMDEKFNRLQHDFDKMTINLAEWQDWARRLSHQVKSLGHEPVAFKPVVERAM